MSIVRTRNLIPDESVERIKAKEKEATRKRIQRRRKKLIDEGLPPEEVADDPELWAEIENAALYEFWDKNISTADPALIAELRSREQTTADLIRRMDAAMSGKTGAESLDAVDADVKKFVNNFGCVDVEVDLERFWRFPFVYNRLIKQPGPTTDFVRFGILTSLPFWRFDQWRARFEPKKPEETPKPVEPVVERVPENIEPASAVPPEQVANRWDNNQYAHHHESAPTKVEP